MHRSATVAGQYVAGLGLAGVATLVSGFALLHLVVAVPQAVFPAVAGPLLLAAAVTTTPAGRRAVRHRTGFDPTTATTLGLVGSALVLCACYLGASLWLA